MKTGKTPRFDVELVTTGHDTKKLEQLLHRVRGLSASPATIVSSCPCTIATNISEGGIKKLQHYLGQLGATIHVRRHNSTTLSSQAKTAKRSSNSSHQAALKSSESQEATTQAVPVYPQNSTPVSVYSTPHYQNNQNNSSRFRYSENHETSQPTTAIATTSITLKRSVGELTRALQDKDWTVREHALLELGKIPSDGVIRHLTKALKDDVWHVRRTAIEMLSKTGSDAVLKDIAKCLDDAVWHVRYQAVEALSQTESDRSVKPLISALHDENWVIRRRAVQALGRLRSKRAASGIMSCLQDEVWHVREVAARALGQIRSEKAVRTLISALRDPNWHVRSMIVSSLWQIGSEQAIQGLVDVLGDEQWMVHWKAAYALGKIGTTDIIPLLAQMEKEPGSFLSELSRKVLSSLDVVVESRGHSQPRVEYRSEDRYANMCYIPAGNFIMGHDDGPDNAKPAHQIFIEGFFIDTYAVTNYQYKIFDPSHEYPQNMDACPVVNVTWEDANAYAEWIGKRLPTEAEWEKAARGGDGRLYPWGDEFDPARCNTEESGIRHVTPVNDYSLGKSCFGVYDMIGNVLEWTADRYAPYPGSSYDNPDVEEQFIVLRGGSWLHPGSRSTCSTRLYAPAANRSNFIGFRCVKDLHNSR